MVHLVGTCPIRVQSSSYATVMYHGVLACRCGSTCNSGTSMNQIHTMLKNVFEKGIDYDYIYRNPCTRVTAPRCNKPNHRAYREKLGIAKECHFMRGLHEISCIMAVRIGLATGQRRGEVFALTWGDVDLDEGTIHVGHNVTYQDVVKTPKTDSGVRTIAIDPTTVDHLSMWKDR